MLKYTTSDFYCAVALIAYGEILIDIDRADERRYMFIFEHTDSLNNIASRYWERTLDIKVHEFISAQKFLKSRMYN